MKAPFCTLRRLISAIATTMAIRTTTQLPTATITFAPDLIAHERGTASYAH